MKKVSNPDKPLPANSTTHNPQKCRSQEYFNQIFIFILKNTSSFQLTRDEGLPSFKSYMTKAIQRKVFFKQFFLINNFLITYFNKFKTQKE